MLDRACRRALALVGLGTGLTVPVVPGAWLLPGDRFMLAALSVGLLILVSGAVWAALGWGRRETAAAEMDREHRDVRGRQAEEILRLRSQLVTSASDLKKLEDALGERARSAETDRQQWRSTVDGLERERDAARREASELRAQRDEATAWATGLEAPLSAAQDANRDLLAVVSQLAGKVGGPAAGAEWPVGEDGERWTPAGLVEEIERQARMIYALDKTVQAVLKDIQALSTAPGQTERDARRLAEEVNRQTARINNLVADVQGVRQAAAVFDPQQLARSLHRIDQKADRFESLATCVQGIEKRLGQIDVALRRTGIIKPPVVIKPAADCGLPGPPQGGPTAPPPSPVGEPASQESSDG